MTKAIAYGTKIMTIDENGLASLYSVVNTKEAFADWTTAQLEKQMMAPAPVLQDFQAKWQTSQQMYLSSNKLVKA